MQIVMNSPALKSSRARKLSHSCSALMRDLSLALFPHISTSADTDADVHKRPTADSAHRAASANFGANSAAVQVAGSFQLVDSTRLVTVVSGLVPMVLRPCHAVTGYEGIFEA